MERIAMSQEERDWLEWLKRAKDGTVTQRVAAEKMEVTERWVRALLVEMKAKGDAVVVHGLRGRESNRRIEEKIKVQAMKILKLPDWHDFGPTFASQQLAKRHKIEVSKETLRKWMTEAGLWTSRRERKKQIHQPRGRRDCLGELVQIDGSHHWWFENRGPKCALLVYIDDATGKLLHLRFAGSENTFDYLIATKAYLREWGKPISFYSDKHGVFRTTHGSEKDRTTGLTQFGRALYELNIDIICANSPQAKGRVERANQTLQDRLVKELRLRGISTIEAANAYAAEFAADFNVRFGKQPRNPKDMHRPLADHENLDGAMCRKEFRTLSQALTLRYDKVLFILDPSAFAKSLAGKKVVVCDYPDGRLEIMEGSKSLPYRTFDKLRSVHRSEIVENKRLDEALSIGGREAGWSGANAQPARPSADRPDQPHIRDSEWQPGQWLCEARHKARRGPQGMEVRAMLEISVGNTRVALRLAWPDFWHEMSFFELCCNAGASAKSCVREATKQE